MSKIVARGTLPEMVQAVANEIKDQYVEYVMVKEIPEGMSFTGQALMIDGRRYYMALPYPHHRIGIMVPGERTSPR